MKALAAWETMPSSDTPAGAEMDRLAEDGWDWFARYTHPKTGLTLHGGAARPDAPEQSSQASLAASGFYLGLLPMAPAQGRVPADEAAERALVTLRFAARSIGHVKGVMLHFVHWDSGKRYGHSEYSVLDTSIFLHGAIVAAGAFGGECARLADELLNRVDWKNLLVEDRHLRRPVISYGFDGEGARLLDHGANVRSSENLMPAVLAAGSRTHRLGPECWYNMSVVRGPGEALHGWTPPPELTRVLNPRHGLFTSYYGLCWMDLRGLHDADGVDLWENARLSALFNREACRRIWATKFSTYRMENGGWWGISAGDGPSADPTRESEYTVSNPVDGDPSGTVWPTAALAAFPWLPRELSQDLVRWKQSPAWQQCRARYGLAPFSLDRNWSARKLLGIDIGSFLINWWNARTGQSHKLWRKHPASAAGIERLEFSHP